jgi:hypothetical protein
VLRREFGARCGHFIRAYSPVHPRVLPGEVQPAHLSLGPLHRHRPTRVDAERLTPRRGGHQLRPERLGQRRSPKRRAFVTDHAAVVLDGASAFLPVDVDPGTYAATLGEVIADRLDDDRAAELPALVRAAISQAAHRLDLVPGRAPSSTVAVLRTRDGVADLYVLGDSPIHYGTATTEVSLTDERLSHVAVSERRRYLSRLRAGHGYDEQHRANLTALQRAQRRACNRSDGYWIAEADPDAAEHGLTRHVPAEAISWAVLASDGAADVIDHTARSWADIAHADDAQLVALLAQLDGWEAITDPDGRALPRAKRHDDKTLIAVASLW